MLGLEHFKANYLYWDLEEVARALDAPRPVEHAGDPEVALCWDRWDSLVRQGAFFKALGRVNWRVVPDPPEIPAGLLDDIAQLGALVEALLAALEKHLLDSPFLRQELGFPACPQEEALWELERHRVLEMMRLDLALENGEHPRLLEIQVVMGGLGITHALRQAYGRHPCLPGILPLYEACLGKVRENFPGPEAGVAAVLGAKNSSYRHEHLVLARSLGKEKLVVAPLLAISRGPRGGLVLPDGRHVTVIHRLFRSPGIFNYAASKARMILEALSENRIRLLNPWRDVMEDKRVLALVHHPEAGEKLGEILEPGQLQKLKDYIPLTWRATPERIAHILALPASKRGYYLKKGRSFESRALFHGRRLSLKQWEAACLKAKAEGDWIIQEEVHSRPWEWRYLEPCSGVIRTMRGYVRLCPFFFRDSQGKMNLADVLITAREESSRVHGASDAVLVVPGTRHGDHGNTSWQEAPRPTAL